MKKYYTIDQAIEKAAYKNNELFSKENNELFKRDTNLSFCRGLYNLTRMYFGLKPKIYYFRKEEKK
jgi:hypothetical protein